MLPRPNFPLPNLFNAAVPRKPQPTRPPCFNLATASDPYHGGWRPLVPRHAALQNGSCKMRGPRSYDTRLHVSVCTPQPNNPIYSFRRTAARPCFRYPTSFISCFGFGQEMLYRGRTLPPQDESETVVRLLAALVLDKTFPFAQPHTRRADVVIPALVFHHSLSLAASVIHRLETFHLPSSLSGIADSLTIPPALRQTLNTPVPREHHRSKNQPHFLTGRNIYCPLPPPHEKKNPSSAEKTPEEKEKWNPSPTSPPPPPPPPPASPPLHPHTPRPRAATSYAPTARPHPASTSRAATPTRTTAAPPPPPTRSSRSTSRPASRRRRTGKRRMRRRRMVGAIGRRASRRARRGWRRGSGRWRHS